MLANLRAAVVPTEYVVAVSAATQATAGWGGVTARLVQKHPGAKVCSWKSSPEEILPLLQQQHPRYLCFVARHEEVSEAFVRKVHQLTRKIDPDPYTDCFWGILTGFDAANALAMAAESDPLTVKNVGSGTEVVLDRCASGVWYCELKKNRAERKLPGESMKSIKGPDDTTQALADALQQADLFVTSGHATEADWQIGFSYRNGTWTSKGGQLFGNDTAGTQFKITAPNRKIYLPIGNCLMGHINGPDAMALAFLNSGGVRQMMGYTVPTWYGYQGWGLLDYFVEQPGRFTLTEAFFANHHALIHRLSCISPALPTAEAESNGRPTSTAILTEAAPGLEALKLRTSDLQGLLFDRDVVAFYGDPAWSARMAEGTKNWEQTLTQTANSVTLTIKPLLGAASFAKVNNNGAQRGGRPVVAYLPTRIDPSIAKLASGSELHPVLTDDFLLVPLPAAPQGTGDPVGKYPAYVVRYAW